MTSQHKFGIIIESNMFENYQKKKLSKNIKTKSWPPEFICINENQT